MEGELSSVITADTNSSNKLLQFTAALYPSGKMASFLVYNTQVL